MRKNSVLKRLVCDFRGHALAHSVVFLNDEEQCYTQTKCLRCGLVKSRWTYSIGSSGYEKLVDMRRNFFEEDYL
jgi:hypothetical protein